ncbi:MAG TPA: D-Ala-D-Ala carboxypeptidase family metallohydrolase [Candidatus Sulfotelmatobacter sp.]|nr:D-Ala-D-Ala carboxypeptidase family metallohydrolase [Candidatus Sulfotelmatobacter sp.]
MPDPTPEQLSENFTRTELECRCGCGTCNVEQSLLDALEQFRRLVNQPIIINSGYRCSKHNEESNGQPDSQHMSGRAADIRVSGKKARELYALAQRIPSIRGIGVDDYRDYIHIDTRPGLYAPVKWCYGWDRLPTPWHEEPAKSA